MDTFGKRLAYLIQQSDYKSTARFAKDLGLSSVTLSNIKREVTDTPLGNVRRMVHLLRSHGVDVDYDWLIDGVNKEDEFSAFKRRTRAQAAELVKPLSNRNNPQLAFPFPTPKMQEVFA